MFGQQQAFFDQLTRTDSSRAAEKGAERWEDGNKYIYVYNESTDTTCADKCAVMWSNAANYKVKPATTKSAPAAGIIQTALDPSKYGWLQVGGFADCTCTGTVAANTTLTVATTAGVLADSSTAGDFQVGYAVADATSNEVKVYLNLV